MSAFPSLTTIPSVCIMTILRTKAVVDFSKPAAKKDFTYTIFQDALWSSLEPSLGVVNTCLPLLPPVISKFTDSTVYSSLKSLLHTSRLSSRRSHTSSHTSHTSHTLVSGEKSPRWPKFNQSKASYESDERRLASLDASQKSERSGSINPHQDIEVTRDIDVQSEHSGQSDRRDYARGPDRV